MPGKLVHVEINAADADRAQGFWSGVFGWRSGLRCHRRWTTGCS